MFGWLSARGTFGSLRPCVPDPSRNVKSAALGRDLGFGSGGGLFDPLPVLPRGFVPAPPRRGGVDIYYRLQQMPRVGRSRPRVFGVPLGNSPTKGIPKRVSRISRKRRAGLLRNVPLRTQRENLCVDQRRVLGERRSEKLFPSPRQVCPGGETWGVGLRSMPRQGPLFFP